ncbi:MAG: phosphatidylserine/phosphatidylglycerophosphate/cardiolipin synthase family protein [Smithellaceae bacterium]
MSQKIGEIKETVFAEANQYFAALMQDIEQAATRIDLETYIFDLDPLGRQVAGHLAAASRRGVSVRLLLDGVGSAIASGKLAEQLSSAGAQVRIYHPLPWNIHHWEWAVPRLPWLAKLQRLLAGMHSRNHRKICMIDHRVAWVGSFNISQCHLTKEKGGQNWRDTALRLEGLDMEHLQHAFDGAWDNDRALIPRRIFSPINIRLNHMHRRELRRDLLNRIAQSRSRIWITNAYFVPITSILRYLKKAARRGVDVRILLPGISDVFFMPWASAVFYGTLLKAGIKIYEYTGGVLHAKIMFLDDWITVGSSNIDYLSFFRNLEAEVVVTLPETKKVLEDQFLNDLTQSEEITINDFPRYPWWRKLFGHLLFSIKRWL